MIARNFVRLDHLRKCGEIRKIAWRRSLAWNRKAL